MALIAHYRLDGDATDALGRFDGTANGVSWVDGKLGQAGSFDGTNDQVTIPALPSMYSFTLAGWVRADGDSLSGASGYNTFMGRAGSGRLLYKANGTLLAQMGNGNHTSSEGAASRNKWHHISYVYDSTTTTAQWFIDGVPDTKQLGTLYFNPNGWVIGGYNSDNYWFNGLIDDVRIYDHALSEREVRDLSLGLVFHLEANEEGPKDKSLQGNAVVNNGAAYVEDVPVGKGGYDFNGVNTHLEHGNNVRNLGNTITACAWVYYRAYGGGGQSYSVIACKGSPFTWLLENPNKRFRFRAGINGVDTHLNATVTHELNRWYHVTGTYDGSEMRLYIDGVLNTSRAISGLLTVNNTPARIGTFQGTNYNLNGVISDVRLYATALTAEQVKELYQQRASLDSRGNIHTATINDTGIKQPLLLNYTQWQDGQTGAVGHFGLNGSTIENFRVLDTDPWGKPTVVWEARPDATSGPDGGWNSASFPVDSSKMYRFSTWVRRPVTGNGTFYLGCNGSPAVLNRSNGASNGDPYFDYRGGLGSEWVLVVGHIWPEGSGTGAVHPDSGRYTVSGGRIGSIVGDYVFAPGTTSCRHRSYLYYSTNVNTRQQWCYPRMDVCDGTEPSIAELLAGFDSRNESLLRANNGQVPKLSISAATSGNFSEVGITDGLVAYYPLTKDAKDYSGNGNHGVVSGAVPVGGGFDGKGAYRFNSDSDNIALPNIIVGEKPFSCTAWTNFDINHSDVTASSNYYAHILTSSDTSFRISVHEHNDIRIGWNGKIYWSGSVDKLFKSNPFTWGQWALVTIIFDGAKITTFHNDQKVAESVVSPNSFLLDRIGSTFRGQLANVKIFNRALSPEEIAVEYKRTGPAKMTQYKGQTFIQGQFKEVIS